MRRLVVSVLLLAALALMPASAQAESRPGQIDDPVGDAQNGGPDLTSAHLDYDTGGTVTARFSFSAPPPSSSDALAAVIVGTRTSSGACSSIFAFGAGLGDSGGSSSQWSAGGSSSGNGTRTLDGATLTIQAQDARLASDDVDCFAARITRITSGQSVDYDTTDVVSLTLPDSDGDGIADRDDRCPSQAAPGQSDGCPPPTTTSTTPTTTTPTTTTPPEEVPPVPTATPLERYDAAVAKCPTRKGSSRTRCLSRAKRAQPAGYRMARKRPPDPFLGKAFFRPDPDPANVCGGLCLHGMVFPDDKWAYRGEPEKGPLLVRCTRVTAVGDKDGCLRYTLSKDRRTATVAGVRYTLRRDGKQITPSGDNGGPLTRVAIPAAGTRVDAVIRNISSFGTTGVNQTFSTSELTFSRDGRFVGAGTVSGSNGQGSDFESTFTAIGPERRGHYAFEPGGTLSFTYDDGKVRRKSAFVAFGPKLQLGRIDRDGLFLDGSPYLHPD